MASIKLHNIKLKYAIYMCNYCCSGVKPLSQKSLQPIAFPIKKLLYESKGTQRLLVRNAET